MFSSFFPRNIFFLQTSFIISLWMLFIVVGGFGDTMCGGSHVLVILCVVVHMFHTPSDLVNIALITIVKSLWQFANVFESIANKSSSKS